MAPAPVAHHKSAKAPPSGQVAKPTDAFYGHEKIATLCARFITALFQCPLSPQGMPSRQLQLPYFIAYAVHRTRLHPCVTYAALVLMQRLKARFPTAKGSSGHRLFISAFMIASKVICDDTYSNRSWSIVAQGLFSLREMNQMERELCSYLDWELTVADPILTDFTNRVEQDFGPHATEPYPVYSLQMVSTRVVATPASASNGNPDSAGVEQSTSSSPIPMFTTSRNPTPVKSNSPSPPAKKRRGSFAPKPVNLPETSDAGTPPHSYSLTSTPSSSPSPSTPVDAEEIHVEVSDYHMDKVLVHRYKEANCMKGVLYSRPAAARW
ncbi:hypothetical protein DL96DRAFT_64634 [Flagelloscypha sp. PMI_526]|nr:hypothetical protein DL96DRAFT_64634 [Flagelloscypha sp. PMI_526]